MPVCAPGRYFALSTAALLLFGAVRAAGCYIAPEP